VGRDSEWFNRLSEAVGNAQPTLYGYALNRADLSDVACVLSLTSPQASEVGAVAYRGPRLRLRCYRLNMALKSAEATSDTSARLPALLIVSRRSCDVALVNRRALREPRPTKAASLLAPRDEQALLQDT
jgi:hypothetical protein